mmetsp:Transcript_16706/g.54602  ORF Transcript_16706/g.54602 Transcript_16706/m.54602 type:complete len:328 (-) Transcript_16706:378-1361(-)
MTDLSESERSSRAEGGPPPAAPKSLSFSWQTPLTTSARRLEARLASSEDPASDFSRAESLFSIRSCVTKCSLEEPAYLIPSSRRSSTSYLPWSAWSDFSLASRCSMMSFRCCTCSVKKPTSSSSDLVPVTDSSISSSCLRRTASSCAIALSIADCVASVCFTSVAPSMFSACCSRSSSSSSSRLLVRASKLSYTIISPDVFSRITSSSYAHPVCTSASSCFFCSSSSCAACWLSLAEHARSVTPYCVLVAISSSARISSTSAWSPMLSRRMRAIMCSYMRFLVSAPSSAPVASSTRCRSASCCVIPYTLASFSCWIITRWPSTIVSS